MHAYVLLLSFLQTCPKLKSNLLQKKGTFRMKKYSVLLALAIIGSSFIAVARPQEVFSRSYMFTRPASYNLAMEQQLWHNFVYDKKGTLRSGIEAIGFYETSWPTAKAARYFLIDRKNQLSVAGDAVTDKLFTRDIRAEWVGLPNDFSGKLSVCPQQRQAGFTFTYSQDLNKLFDMPFLKDWTFGIELPVIWVENNINFTQCDIVSTGTQVGFQTDIISAFNQPNWCYGRIPACKQKAAHPAELKFTLGRAFLTDRFQLASFSELLMPLGNSQDAQYMFSPVVGNGRHWALGGAVLMQLLLNENTDRAAWTFFVNLEGLFLCRNKQWRTYDLQGRPWSRYMLYTRRNSPPGSTIPGVNLLTFHTLVRPFGMADFSTGWRVTTDWCEFELGYDLWGHGGERIHLNTPPVDSPFNRHCGGLNEFGIAGAGTIIVDGQEVAASASTSDIARRGPDDPVFITINENDIDLDSATAASALNQKLHFAMGLQHKGEKVGGFAGVGFFFEFPQKNSPLRMWGTWFKIGGTF